MFISSLFTTVKTWKQLKYLSVGEGTNKLFMTHSYNRMLCGNNKRMNE